jgi:hypothetical protein
MTTATPWYADRDPETGQEFITDFPFYTWGSGWARFGDTLGITDEGQEYLTLKPIVGKLDDYNYALERVDLSENPTAPRPAYIRPLDPPETVRLMLHIINDDTHPTIGGPFRSGLVKKRVPSRIDRYITSIQTGSPTLFAMVVREEAIRWRQRRVFSAAELSFLKRVYFDMLKEIELSFDIPEDKAEQMLQKAFGGNPFGRSTTRVRRPKPPPRRKN